MPKSNSSRSRSGSSSSSRSRSGSASSSGSHSSRSSSASSAKSDKSAKSKEVSNSKPAAAATASEAAEPPHTSPVVSKVKEEIVPVRQVRVYVGRLTRSVTKEHIGEIFGTYGPIKQVDMPVEVISHSTFNKGFAYIEFEKPEDAENSCKYMDGGQIDGQEVTVNISQPAPLKPAVEARERPARQPSPPRRQRSPPRQRYRPSPNRRGGGGGGGGGGGYRGRSRSPVGRGGRRSRSPVGRRSRSPRGGRRGRNRSSSSGSSS